MTPTEWLQNMRNIWLEKQPDAIADILSTTIEYYEDPTKPPLTNISDIIDEWQAIKNQDIEYVEIEILHETNNIATALWRFKERQKPEHIGCYFLILDEDGKCTHFRQWWHSV